MFVIPFFVYACGQVSSDSSTPVGYSTINGTVYAADGVTPLGGVRVWTSGSIIETTSEVDGTWTLENVPLYSDSETKLVTAESGSWKIDFSVNAQVGVTSEVATSETTFTEDNLTDAVDLAVIKGTYDRIEDLITALGYSYTTIEVADLDNYDNISTFEAIFIDCGAPGTTSFGIDAQFSNLSTTGRTNLQNFVEDAGKSLYASDWAAEFVEKVWPSAIDFYGSDSTSTSSIESISSAKVGTGKYYCFSHCCRFNSQEQCFEQGNLQHLL